MTYRAEIEQMAQHFAQLVESQLERIQKMEEGANCTPLKDRPIITVGICPGDGIGPIITREAIRVMHTLLASELAAGKIILKEIDGLTLEHRLETGSTVPPDVLAEMKSCDVLLKGPTTTPQQGAGVANMESANVTLRKELDLYANIRPIAIPEEDIDWIFFRENTEGEYALGSQGVALGDKMTFDFKVTTQLGTRRIARAAFDHARANGKTNVAIVTKANIMKKTDGMFSEICHEIAKDYPEITAEDWYIDIMTANLLNPNLRSKYQVVLLPNLYGDILTDEAAQIQGGVGTAGSGNIGDQYAMFEAIHGSAPRMVAEGLGNYANPASLLSAVALMLTHIGYANHADKLTSSMVLCDAEKSCQMTGDATGATCQQYTDHLISLLQK